MHFSIFSGRAPVNTSELDWFEFTENWFGYSLILKKLAMIGLVTNYVENWINSIRVHP